MWRGRLGSPQCGPSGVFFPPTHPTRPLCPCLPALIPPQALLHCGEGEAGLGQHLGALQAPHSSWGAARADLVALPAMGAPLGFPPTPGGSWALIVALPGWTKTHSRPKQLQPQLRLPLGSAPVPSSPSVTTKPSSVSSPKRNSRGCRCGRSAPSPTNRLFTATPSPTSPTPTSAPSKSSGRPTRNTSQRTGCPAPPPPPPWGPPLPPAPTPTSVPPARRSSSSKASPQPERQGSPGACGHCGSRPLLAPTPVGDGLLLYLSPSYLFLYKKEINLSSLRKTRVRALISGQHTAAATPGDPTVNTGCVRALVFLETLQ